MLVSVKSPAEATLAAATTGVTVIDVKDPTRGSLGFAGSEVTNRIAAVVKQNSSLSIDVANSGDHKLVSVALGELQYLDFDEVSRINWANFDFVKLGLNGLYKFSRWRSPLNEALAGIPQHVQRVLVLYVDQVDATAAVDMVQPAAEDGLGVVLLDTFDKSRGNIFAHWTDAEIRSVFRTSARLSMKTVLAGSIGRADLSRALAMGADLIGVRGAVCDGERSGNLSQQRLDELLSTYRELESSSATYEAGSRLKN